MKNLVAAIVLSSLALSASACSVTQTPGAVTLTVGSPGCLKDPKKLNEFALQLKRAIAQSEAGGGPAQPQSASSVRAEKLKKFSDLKHQAKHLSTPASAYYGQR